MSHTDYNKFLYTVYRNSDDKLVILDGTAKECARAMGLSRTSSFYVILTSRGGKTGKWTIIKTSRAEIEADTEGLEAEQDGKHGRIREGA